jgi:hypothetical protein
VGCQCTRVSYPCWGVCGSAPPANTAPPPPHPASAPGGGGDPRPHPLVTERRERLATSQPGCGRNETAKPCLARPASVASHGIHYHAWYGILSQPRLGLAGLAHACRPAGHRRRAPRLLSTPCMRYRCRCQRARRARPAACGPGAHALTAPGSACGMYQPFGPALLPLFPGPGPFSFTSVSSACTCHRPLPLEVSHRTIELIGPGMTIGQTPEYVMLVSPSNHQAAQLPGAVQSATQTACRPAQGIQRAVGALIQSVTQLQPCAHHSSACSSHPAQRSGWGQRCWAVCGDE